MDMKYIEFLWSKCNKSSSSILLYSHPPATWACVSANEKQKKIGYYNAYEYILY